MAITSVRPKIQNFLGQFQVELRKRNSGDRNVSVSMSVFKKKDLAKYGHKKVYDHNIQYSEIEDLSGCSKVSCVRCRKFKKKCSRELPECSNCQGSDDLCVYQPRKKKEKKKTELPKQTKNEPESADSSLVSHNNYSYNRRSPSDFALILN